MERNTQKTYLTDKILLETQHLWQARSQILLIFSLREFIKLNVNTDMIIKHVKPVELKTMIAGVFLNTQTLKLI